MIKTYIVINSLFLEFNGEEWLGSEDILFIREEGQMMSGKLIGEAQLIETEMIRSKKTKQSKDRVRSIAKRKQEAEGDLHEQQMHKQQ